MDTISAHPDPDGVDTGLFGTLYRRFTLVVGLVAVATAALVVPLLTMAPTESASTEPTGPVFTARDRIDERFVSSVHPIFFVVEDDEGDILRAEPLRELLRVSDELRADPEIAPTLLTYFDVESETEVVGLVTVADLVDAQLPGGLAEATDAEVKAVGAALVDQLGQDSEALAFSTASTQAADGTWTVPAVTPLVVTDNQILGFGNTSVSLGGGTDVEEYDREVQEVLRGAEGLSVWGIAIDVNLTSQEQGAVAGPFIGFTIAAVLLIVGLTFGSYWVVATVGSLLIALIVWLKGITNLIGFEDDLVLSLIVPVAMISFGVDFAFHAIGRYREERAEGLRPARAFPAGLTAVSGALILALTSGIAAFLANVSAGIESIVQFGIGAAIALAAAYLLLGIISPMVVSRIEADIPTGIGGRGASVGRVIATVGAAMMVMASVLLIVFVAPVVGVIVATVTVLAILVVPYQILRNRHGATAVAHADAARPSADNRGERISEGIGGAIATLARARLVVLPLAVAISAVAAVFALRVETAFDVEDFFSSDTDFVVGLNELDDHVGDRGGEPAIIYVEGDLSDPEALATVSSALDEVRALDVGTLAKLDGEVDIRGGIFDVFDAVWASPAAQGMITATSGVELTDTDGNRIPDTREQIEAIVAVGSERGIPFDEQRLALTPDDVQTSIDLDGLSADQPDAATVFELGLVNSRAQESVADARTVLDPITEQLGDDLGGTFVQVTGSPFVRGASLDATSRALIVSLPIALGICLAIAALFLRSLRYGLAAIVPILMVVAWLYGFMEVAGYSINIVTATIGAVSIGIGIDFALHYIARYREELARHGSRNVAVRIAGEGTGAALVASAVSSAVGFGIMAFAPMPLFAAYGLLTALMIAMALVATLVVLPGLLVLITRDAEPGADSVDLVAEREVASVGV
ncbi:MAG: MMPL family transporter [Actinomycetota bacterium]